MTFLEFVLRRLIGPPAGNYWGCPACEHPTPSLAVNLPRGGHQIKFRCFRCRLWGDEFDLLKLFNPRADYGARLVLAGQWRREWEEAEVQAEASSSSPKGSTDYERRVAIAWANLMDDLRANGLDPDDSFRRLTGLYEAGYFGDGAGMRDVLAYWAEFRAWVAETNDAHFTACSDPQCDWYCCRAVRGLPPLTREEAAQQKAVEEAERQQRVESLRLQIRETIARRRRR